MEIKNSYKSGFVFCPENQLISLSLDTFIKFYHSIYLGFMKFPVYKLCLGKVLAGKKKKRTERLRQCL